MNLRNAVLVCALAATAAGLLLAALGRSPGLQLAIGAGVFALLVLGERWRYRRSGQDRGGGRFEPTGERYRDPGTGEWMEVQYDARSGARRYVRIDPPPAP